MSGKADPLFHGSLGEGCTEFVEICLRHLNRSTVFAAEPLLGSGWALADQTLNLPRLKGGDPLHGCTCAGLAVIVLPACGDVEQGAQYVA
ncbi:MAG: hypothetical protein R3313_00955, partial [Candidatus Saccharimonadales bacterium]|nr:hypothetical protein [Candidatus Saccharimonadales bacterium]